MSNEAKQSGDSFTPEIITPHGPGKRRKAPTTHSRRGRAHTTVKMDVLALVPASTWRSDSPPDPAHDRPTVRVERLARPTARGSQRLRIPTDGTFVPLAVQAAWIAAKARPRTTMTRQAEAAAERQDHAEAPPVIEHDELDPGGAPDEYPSRLTLLAAAFLFALLCWSFVFWQSW